MNGVVDDVRIYNRALSADEIQALHLAPPPPAAGSLQVAVRRSDTNAFLPGVTVALGGGPSTPAPQTTGSDGTTTFANLEAGTYTVTASLPGFESGSTAVTVSANTTASAPLSLTPSTSTLPTIQLIDYFPKQVNGENGIWLQYRDAGGAYTDLVYKQDYFFYTPGTPWDIPVIHVWDRDTAAILSHPSAVTQVGYERDSIIRVTLHGDSPTVRVTGMTARVPGASSMRFYIYQGAANATQPLWETWNEGTFDLILPYTDGEPLFFAVDAGPDDINDWALWRDIRLQGIVLEAPVPANTPPIADAGLDQSPHVGETVTLDGSGSTDVDGDLLSYAWALTTRPPGSNATLNDGTAVNPTFTVDKAGTYVVSLVVNDGQVDSQPATVSISTLNSAPVANAGADQSVYVGSLVTLDGSGSTDVDGNPLTYQWALTTRPDGSGATLSSATAVNPTFTVDKAGTYVVSLVVNDGQVDSQPATVSISTINVAPVADAGPDQSITLIGATVHLNGSQSYDPDGDSITYEWSLISKPAGSQSVLVGADTATPTFVADVHGDYVAQLIVKDTALSSTDTVTVSFDNVKPVANAGASQSVIVGDTVTLNGSNSTDANGDPLTYTWTFSTLPTGSGASIASPTNPVTSFVPDLPGTYTVQLVVNDGLANSDPSTSQVEVVSEQSAAITTIQGAQMVVAPLDSSVLVNANMGNALLNKLNAVIANIEAGRYADALGQLQHDILAKTDGCATSNTPDKNDWIKDCSSQSIVYPRVLECIAAVQRLL